MTTLAEAIREYQLCPGRLTMTRFGACDRRTGCPNTCKGTPAAAIATPAPVIAPAPCRDTGKGVKRREVGKERADGHVGAFGRECDFQRWAEWKLRELEIEYFHCSQKSRDKPGWPDLTFPLAGRFVAIELKTREGRLSEDQIEVLGKLEKCGALVAVCREGWQVLDVLGGGKPNDGWEWKMEERNNGARKM